MYAIEFETDIENGKIIIPSDFNNGLQQHVKVIIMNCRQNQTMDAVKASKPPRPKVGTITSPPVVSTHDAFSPLSETELKDWGITE